MSERVYVVDDDDIPGQSIAHLLDSFGIRAEILDRAGALLDRCPLPAAACVLSDMRVPDMNGLALISALRARREPAPVILMTRQAEVDVAVAAFRNGAQDFLRKPCNSGELVEAVRRALERSRALAAAAAARRDAQERLSRLSDREQEVARLLVQGMSNKRIGLELGISFRTVEHHRRRVLDKTEAGSLVELGFLVQAAEGD